MNEHLGWIAAATVLATISTGGGGYVEHDAEPGRDYIGRDKIINATQEEWRRWVDERIRENRAMIAENRRLMADNRRAITFENLALGAVVFAFILVVIVSAGVAVRQFDQMSLQIERQIDRIERQLEQRIP